MTMDKPTREPLFFGARKKGGALLSQQKERKPLYGRDPSDTSRIRWRASVPPSLIEKQYDIPGLVHEKPINEGESIETPLGRLYITADGKSPRNISPPRNISETAFADHTAMDAEVAMAHGAALSAGSRPATAPENAVAGLGRRKRGEGRGSQGTQAAGQHIRGARSATPGHPVKVQHGSERPWTGEQRTRGRLSGLNRRPRTAASGFPIAPSRSTMSVGRQGRDANMYSVKYIGVTNGDFGVLSRRVVVTKEDQSTRPPSTVSGLSGARPPRSSSHGRSRGASRSSTVHTEAQQSSQGNPPTEPAPPPPKQADTYLPINPNPNSGWVVHSPLPGSALPILKRGGLWSNYVQTRNPAEETTSVLATDPIPYISHKGIMGWKLTRIADPWSSESPQPVLPTQFHHQSSPTHSPSPPPEGEAPVPAEAVAPVEEEPVILNANPNMVAQDDEHGEDDMTKGTRDSVASAPGASQQELYLQYLKMKQDFIKKMNVDHMINEKLAAAGYK